MQVDKLNRGLQGDPAGALLEVLDPEQNHTFVDHYLGISFDLSNVLFICTANTSHTISPPLKDRMELIDVHGYTQEEKLEIAQRYLIPKQLKKHGLETQHLDIPSDSTQILIGMSGIFLLNFFPNGEYSRLRLIGSHRSEDILPRLRDPINRKYVLAYMNESYSSPAKSGPIKRLTRLNSDPIKRSRL